MSLFARPLVGLPEGAARALPAIDDEGREGPLSLRVSDEDFIVEEVPLYPESGEGEHLYLHVRKRGLSTPDLLRRLCRHFGLKESEVGIAGRKDARGVTSQRISVPARVVEGREHELSELGPVELLSAKRHRNKLRLGHLAGNRFTIRVAGDVDVAVLAHRGRLCEERGFASYFGAQRFGPDDESLREAERFLARERPARTRKETFLVSVVQAALFNAWLDARLRAETFERALFGDVLLKAGNLAPFTCTDPETDTPRVERREVFVSGPLWGSEMRRPDRDALTFESRSLEELGVSESALMSHPAFRVGARRPACVLPSDVVVRASEGEEPGAVLSFTLPPGSYATVFLREICGPRLLDRAFDSGGGDPFAA